MSFDLDKLLQAARQRRLWGAAAVEPAAPPPAAEALQLCEQLAEEAAALLGARAHIVAPLLLQLRSQLGELFPGAGVHPAAPAAAPAEPERLLALDTTLNEIEDVVEALLLAAG